MVDSSAGALDEARAEDGVAGAARAPQGHTGPSTLIVRIVFSMWHLGSFRMYESVVRELARRGHQVHVAVGRDAFGRRDVIERVAAEFPGVTWGWLATPSAAFWPEVGKTIRLWADYLRYFHADYEATPQLKARAEERVPPRLVRISNSRFFATAGRRRRLLSALRNMERALPPVEAIARELREHQPDLVLVTPLIFLGSSQFEVVRRAQALGIRTALAVGSWDHLSSKALIRDMPDRVYVWNETQQSEAVRLHGVPADRVIVTGGQCYDQWFERQPVRSRTEFCRHVGLPDDRPFLLYVCSALFRGSPVEAEFVKHWLERLRASPDPVLREVAVLVRPHPARMDEWKDVDISGIPDVTFYGSNPIDDASKDDYFESLHYSRAIAGLNTSAFIEGAIAGRPVHTILLPEFYDNQEGVLHFHYLFTVGGGVLRAGRTFEEHHAQLAASLVHSAERPGDGFVRAFVRPHGLTVAATPLFCDAVEAQLRQPAPAPVRTPPAYTVLRWAMYPTLRWLRWWRGAEVVRDDWSRREQARRTRRVRAEQDRSDRQRRVLEQREEKERRRVAAITARDRRIARRAQLRVLKTREKATRTKRHQRAKRFAHLKGRVAGLFGKGMT